MNDAGSVLLAEQGLVVVVAATAGRRSYRQRARERAPRFLEVEIATSLEECERRDSKKLYSRARAGLLLHVPGIDAPYEPAEAPDAVATCGLDEQALEIVLAKLGGT